MGMSGGRLEIHLGALRANIRTALKIIGKNNFFYPFVKSEAYGLGLLEVTRILQEEGCCGIGLLNTQEAQKISSNKIKILIFGPIENAKEFVQNPHWIPVLSSFEDLNHFSQTMEKKHKPRLVHIKFDVGLSRLGFEEKNLNEIISFFKNNKVLQLEGVCTHLSRGESAGISNSTARNQIKQFKNIGQKIAKHFPAVKNHLFNSSAFLAHFCHDLDMEFGARLGGFLYGIKHDIEHKTQKAFKKWSELKLQPVSSLKAFLLSSRIIPRGRGVSYDSLWKAKKNSRIAVVSMGYADGLPKNLTGGDVLFRGQKVKVIGAVCMNFFMIDLTPVLGLKEKPKRGEEIVIYGNEISIQEYAKALGLLPYEVMTRIAPSVQRIYDDL